MKKRTNRSVFGWAALVLAMSAAPAYAGPIIYDNGGPCVLCSGNDASLWVQADDFSLVNGGLVADAGIYLAFTAGGAWDGSLSYWIFADAAGSPGAILTSGQAQNVAISDSGIAWCCGGNAQLFRFDLASAFLAAPGTTYWFGIHAAADFDTRDDIYWVLNGLAGNSMESFGGTFNNWINVSDGDRAFFLTTTEVPEPMTLLLLGSGLGAAALRRRRATRS
jgi:hypothetical protein